MIRDFVDAWRRIDARDWLELVAVVAIVVAVAFIAVTVAPDLARPV